MSEGLLMPGTADFEQFVDPKAIDVQVEEKTIGAKTFARITQHFAEGEGDQSLIAVDGADKHLVAKDNVVDFPDENLQAKAMVAFAGSMTDAEHAKVADKAVASVDVYKTGEGPDHGNLACMWSTRHLVHDAVGHWITQQNGTAAFYGELQGGGVHDHPADDIPPGGIIISPTSPHAVGHVGILGKGHGRSRLVYSNHSPSARDPVARWLQNYTVGSFTDAHAKHGLKTLFYRLPLVRGG